MDVKKQKMDNIQQRLAYLKTRVEIAGSLNLTDIHIYAEDFYRDFFNKLGHSFSNINFDKQNSAFIDLIDDTNKTAIQVTAQNDSEKITSSIQGFYSSSEYKDYSLKVLLISKKAKDYRADFTKGGQCPFDHKKDVIDLARLIAEIKDKDTSKIIEISKFLDAEILMPRPKTESNEVETIMALLEYLSDDGNYKKFDGIYECDPEKKINSRFKEYADSFKEEFVDLFATYCNTVSESKKAFGLDGVRAMKVSNFLRQISNRYLREAQDNPIEAFENLSDFFEGKLSSNGIQADIGAIRYYLLDELIGCNIFSNKE